MQIANDQVIALITIGACAIGEWIHEEGIMGNPEVGFDPGYTPESALEMLDKLAALRKMVLASIGQDTVQLSADWLNDFVAGKIHPDEM